MTREEAHKLVDELFDFKETQTVPSTSSAVTPSTSPVTPASEAEEPKRELPKDKRVVRTKTSGDRVYLLDDTKKIRQWVTNPEVLKSLGFEMADVKDVEDIELLKFQMGAALYRVGQNAAA